MWFLVGDFNAVTRSRERKGVGNSSGSQEIIEFNSWVNEMQLVDPPFLGRKFTWYRADGSAMSRLDRFLLSEEWATEWEVVPQWA